MSTDDRLTMALYNLEQQLKRESEMSDQPAPIPAATAQRCTPEIGHYMRYGDTRCECGEVQTFTTSAVPASADPVCPQCGDIAICQHAEPPPLDLTAIKATFEKACGKWGWRHVRPIDLVQVGEFVADLPRNYAALIAEVERLHSEVTRAVLRYTFKGYQAGENADSKRWRVRAETAEAEVDRLRAQAVPEGADSSIVGKIRLFVERMRALGGVPELCDLAWNLCNENEQLKRQRAATEDAIRALVAEWDAEADRLWDIQGQIGTQEKGPSLVVEFNRKHAQQVKEALLPVRPGAP